MTEQETKKRNWVDIENDTDDDDDDVPVNGQPKLTPSQSNEPKNQTTTRGNQDYRAQEPSYGSSRGNNSNYNNNNMRGSRGSNQYGDNRRQQNHYDNRRGGEYEVTVNELRRDIETQDGDETQFKIGKDSPMVNEELIRSTFKDYKMLDYYPDPSNLFIKVRFTRESALEIIKHIHDYPFQMRIWVDSRPNKKKSHQHYNNDNRSSAALEYPLHQDSKNEIKPNCDEEGFSYIVNSKRHVNEEDNDQDIMRSFKTPGGGQAFSDLPYDRNKFNNSNKNRHNNHIDNLRNPQDDGIVIQRNFNNKPVPVVSTPAVNKLNAAGSGKPVFINSQRDSQPHPPVQIIHKEHPQVAASQHTTNTATTTHAVPHIISRAHPSNVASSATTSAPTTTAEAVITSLNNNQAATSTAPNVSSQKSSAPKICNSKKESSMAPTFLPLEQPVHPVKHTIEYVKKTSENTIQPTTTASSVPQVVDTKLQSKQAEMTKSAQDIETVPVTHTIAPRNAAAATQNGNATNNSTTKNSNHNTHNDNTNKGNKSTLNTAKDQVGSQDHSVPTTAVTRSDEKYVKSTPQNNSNFQLTREHKEKHQNNQYEKEPKHHGNSHKQVFVEKKVVEETVSNSNITTTPTEQQQVQKSSNPQAPYYENKREAKQKVVYERKTQQKELEPTNQQAPPQTHQSKPKGKVLYVQKSNSNEDTTLQQQQELPAEEPVKQKKQYEPKQKQSGAVVYQKKQDVEIQPQSTQTNPQQKNQAAKKQNNSENKAVAQQEPPNKQKKQQKNKSTNNVYNCLSDSDTE